MISALKAEVRKLLTVRSTYFILAIVLILLVFFGFFVAGYKVDHHDLMNPTTLAGDVTGAVNVISVFVALIAILLLTHEYRYNTILYTLTLANRRSKVLLAKIVVISALAILVTLIAGVLSPLLSVLGANLHHLRFAHQNLDYSNLLWRSLFFGWGYGMAGLVIASLVRNQIGAIIILFIAPETVEGLLSLLLKKNTAYLPFTALHNTIGQGAGISNIMTPFHAALVFLAYLVVAWIVAWVLFVRRDAN